MKENRSLNYSYRDAISGIYAETQKVKFNFTEMAYMYLNHLISLYLIKPIDSSYIADTNPQHSKVIFFTDFGKLFVKACIPEKGFVFVND